MSTTPGPKPKYESTIRLIMSDLVALVLTLGRAFAMLAAPGCLLLWAIFEYNPGGTTTFFWLLWSGYYVILYTVATLLFWLLEVWTWKRRKKTNE